MIELGEKDWIDKGNHKSVYSYPGDPSKCIKIVYKESDSDINREMFYRKILSLKNKKINLIPDYYGRVDTNLGKGYCFERIRNDDGTGCQNLFQYMSKIHPEELEKIKKTQDLLLKFKKEFLNSVVITTDVDPWNYLLQKKGDEVRIRIIDNIGTPVAIPLMYFVKPMAIYHNRRSWKRFCREQMRKSPVVFTREFAEILSKID